MGLFIPYIMAQSDQYYMVKKIHINLTAIFPFQVFAGNTDRHTVVSHDLANPIIAKFIRINAISWHGYICLRAEFYGCREGEGLIGAYHNLLHFLCYSKRGLIV